MRISGSLASAPTAHAGSAFDPQDFLRGDSLVDVIVVACLLVIGLTAGVAAARRYLDGRW